MSQLLSEWLTGFLEARGLVRPDGRALYAYRCTHSEFEELTKTLSQALPRVRRIRPSERSDHQAFCLWAAEWWRRNHEGGPWKWEGLLAEIGCEHFAPGNPGYSVLCEMVVSGVRGWERELLTSARGRAFLVTLACEGGLPLRLVSQEQAGLRRYFRALLEEFRVASSASVPPKQLAERVRLRLPQSLRHDVVYELSGQLISKIWELQAEVGDATRPVLALDKQRPRWRDEMPLEVEDSVARALLNGLVGEASAIARQGARRIRWARRLKKKSGVWQLRADLELPGVMQLSEFSALFDSEGSQVVPERFDLVRISGTEAPELAAIGTRRFDEIGVEYLALEGSPRSGRRVSGEAAAEGCSLAARDGRRTWATREFSGAESLASDLPWIFESRGEEIEDLRFVGEGSCTLRAPQAIVAVPSETSIEVEEGSSLDEMGSIDEIGRRVVAVQGTVGFVDEAGARSVVRTGIQGATGPVEYRLRGKRRSFGRGSSELFEGLPEVVAEHASGRTQPIPHEQLVWRPHGLSGVWRAYEPACRGDVQIRHMIEGELRFSTVAKIAPDGASVGLQPAKGGGLGIVALKGFAAGDVWVEQSTEVSGQVDRDAATGDHSVSFACPQAPPATANLIVEWAGERRLRLEVPFPALGASFREPNGQQLTDRARIAVRNLSGVSAQALVPRTSCAFYLDGQYRSSDSLSSGSQHMDVREAIPEVGFGQFEYDLGDIQNKLELILSMSDDLDGAVELEIESNEVAGLPRRRVRVSRYDLKFQPDREIREIALNLDSFARMDEDGMTRIRAEAFALWEPQSNPIELERVRNGVWEVPVDKMEAGPWLIVGWDGGWCRLRPFLWMIGAELEEEPEEAWVDPRSDAEGDFAQEDAVDEAQPEVRSFRWASNLPTRKNRIQAFWSVLKDMAQDSGHPDWEAFDATVRWSRDIPASAFDLMDALIGKPEAAAIAALRCDDDEFQILWDRLETLPFSWRSVPAAAWQTAAEAYVGSLQAAFRDLGDAAASLDPETLVKEQFERRVNRIVNRLPCVEPVLRQCGQRQLGLPMGPELEALFTGALGGAFLGQRDEARANLVRDRADDDRWPGSDRLSTGLHGLRETPEYRDLWLFASLGARFQQDVLDAPVVAALLAVEGTTPSRGLMQDLRRLSEFAPQWYAEAHRAAFLYAFSQKTSERTE